MERDCVTQVQALRLIFVGQLQFEMRKVGEKSLTTVTGQDCFPWHVCLSELHKRRCGHSKTPSEKWNEFRLHYNAVAIRMLRTHNAINKLTVTETNTSSPLDSVCADDNVLTYAPTCVLLHGDPRWSV